MNPITLIIIYFIIFIGPVITISSTHLLLAGLDISLLAIIPLFINKKTHDQLKQQQNISSHKLQPQ